MAEHDVVDDVVEGTFSGSARDITRGCFGVLILVFSILTSFLIVILII